MNKADRKALAEYARWVANELGLRDWTFTISEEPAVGDEHNDVNATCTPCTQRKVAELRFASWTRERDAEGVRETVVHELLHCHLASCQDIVRLDLVKQLSQSTYDAIYFGWVRQMEYAVDGIASSIAKHFPLIQWPESKKTAA